MISAKSVEDPVEFYAEKLHGCFTSMGTNDNLLIRLVVPRSEVKQTFVSSVKVFFE